MAYKDRFEFYRSVEWTRFRDIFLGERLARDGELICEHCNKVILHPYEAILHHKIELNDVNVFDANIALNPDNIMLVCHKSHNEIHERFGYHNNVKKIMVVWGSPCAGKSKFVMDSAGKGDLIIDIDRLYWAMGVDDNRAGIKSNVLSVYRSLVDMVRTRNGRWNTAWIVRTLPLNIDREGLIRELGGGELIHIDTPKEICLEEAKNRGGDWLKWTEQYWSRYQEPKE